MLFIRVHYTTMRHTWGVKHEETTRIKQGSHTYCMRRWLRLHVVQPIMSSYPLPMSMLFPRGIDCNSISGSLISTMLQTSFSLYLYNQWTVFYKLSWSGKLQMRAICIYMEYTKVTTNNQDIRLSVTVKSLFANIW